MADAAQTAPQFLNQQAREPGSLPRAASSPQTVPPGLGFTPSRVVVCSTCGKPVEVKSRRRPLPKAWKRRGDGVYCDDCWKQRYVLRAITMEVVKPLGDEVGWDELRAAVKDSCGQATSVTNWIMSRMFAADRPRKPDDKKFGRFSFDYKTKAGPLYHECREMWPDFDSRSISSLMRGLESKYRHKRWEILWTGESSLPSARNPQPYPVHNQAWKPMFVPAGFARSAREYWEEVLDRDPWLAQARELMPGKKDDAILHKAQKLAYKAAGKDKKKDNRADLVPAVEVPLIGGKMLLQLRQGKDWRGQVADFKKFVSGEAIKGELAILLKRVNSKSHGNGIEARDEGGQKITDHVKVKMVGWFPRMPRKHVDGSLFLSRGEDALLVASRSTEKGMGVIRTWHCGHLKRWAAEGRKRNQQWGDDRKAENRRPHASFASRQQAKSVKHHNRNESAQKELSHQIAELCRRLRVATLEYDDTDYGYFKDWTWSAFEVVLANKLNEYGVIFNRKGTDA